VDIVVLNGAFAGVVYGLLGVGLVVVYRGSRIINFAYGETGMIGAFVFVELVTNGFPLLAAMLAGIALSGGVGAATEWLVVRPLRDQPPLTAMVGTLAVASLLLAYGSRRYGLAPRYVQPLLGGDGIEVAGLTLRPAQLLIATAAAMVLAGLALLTRGTAFGLRMRATALDPMAAGLSGVDTHVTSLVTWAMAGALAGLSAILVAPLISSFTVFFMTTLLLRSLAAALVGGLTSIGGAFVAGIVLGVLEGVIGYLSPVTGTAEVVLAGGVILLMLARPSGLVRTAY
jgi:branched-chain amino acid transport system permease protein